MKYQKIPFQRFLDQTLGKFMIWLTKIKYKKKLSNPKRILILKLSAMGDAVLSLPMIKKLKEETKFEIWVLASPDNVQVFEGHEFIDHIRVMDTREAYKLATLKLIRELKRKSFDVVIDTSQSANFSSALSKFLGRSNIGFKNEKTPIRNNNFDYLVNLKDNEHMVMSYLKLLRPLNILSQNKPHLILPKFSIEDGEIVTKKIGNKKNLVGIHATNLLPYRMWSPKNFAKIMDYLIEMGYSPVLVGSVSENEQVEEIIKLTKNKGAINLTGISLTQLFAIVKKFKFFIANDGGPMHIAAAGGIPVLGLFGSDTPFRYAPFNENSLSIYKGVCSPCNQPHKLKWSKCDNPICLKSISPLEVIECINWIINNFKNKAHFRK